MVRPRQNSEPLLKNGQPSHCVRCDELDNEDMASCANCERWFHLGCLLDTEPFDKRTDWFCGDCIIPPSITDNGNIASTSRDATTPANNEDQSSQFGPFDASKQLNKNISSPLNVEQQNNPVVLRRLVENLRRSHREQIMNLKRSHHESELRSRVQLDRLTRLLEVKDGEDAVAQRNQNPSGLRLHLPPPPPIINASQPFDANEFKQQALSTISATLDGLLADKFSFVPPAPRSAPVITTSFHPFRDASSFGQRSGQDEATVVNNPRDAGEGSTWDRVAVQMSRKYLQKLPTFNGEVRKWGFFEAVYNSTTLSGKYSEADNVCRLREALKPPASDLVESLLNFSTDATGIMRELRESYGRPTQLMLALLDDLFKIPNMLSMTDPKLREFSIKINNFVANVKALHQVHELFSGITLEKLTQKLHVLHHLEWKKAKGERPELNIEDFASFLNKKVKEIPDGYMLRSKSPLSKRDDAQRSKSRRVNSHQHSSGESSNVKVFDSGCFKCGASDHQLPRCKKFIEMTQKERSRFVYQTSICSACISKRDHKWQDCPAKRSCNLQGCVKNHHRLLHNNNFDARRPTGAQNNLPPLASGSNQPTLRSDSNDFVPRNQGEARNSGAAGTSTATNNPVLSHNFANEVLFKIVPVKIFGEDKSFIETFAFLDDGSSLTLIDNEIFNQLKLSGKKEKLRLQWTKGITRVEDSRCATVNISGVKGRQEHTLTNVYAVKNLDLPTQSVVAEDLKSRYRHLRGLPIPDLHHAKPKILIGLQHTNLLLCGQPHCGHDNEPVACKTRLGWIVFGNASTSLGIHSLTHSRTSTLRVSFHDAIRSDDEPHRLVKGFFTTENFGVMPPLKDLVSKENQRAIDIMNRTLKFEDGRYEIGLLWKSDNIRLPDSYPMALSRLISLERSLKRKPDLLEWKNNHVRELVHKGYARKATELDLNGKWPRVWYCPTFIVVNENKVPPKPRDVADVAAQVRGESLNSNLLKGPDNMAPLLSGLCKFRENFVAVTADVKEMFHQVKIIPEDQQCQRFLWRDGDESQTPTIYIMERMMFGPTCSPVCAQFVKNFHAQKFAEEKPDAVDGICRRTYVDDYLYSHETVEDAVKVSKDSIEICKSMGFDLRSFQSSHRSLLDQLPNVNVKAEPVSFDQKDSDDLITKILGLYWLADSDHFTFKMTQNELVDKMLDTSYQPTKREVLKTLMKTFDPLGLIAHYIIRGKIVLQEIWREGVDWDEPVPAELSLAWKQFLRELPNIENLRIPRHYAPVTPAKSYVELIVFVDASEQAFAATAYLRFSTEGNIHVAHVMAKAKVAPIKKLTIPQLELQAAVLGIRLASSVKKLHAFIIHDTKYLSDSRVVLSWICSTKYKFKTFVAARVGEILETSTRREWFHVGTKENVADDATKWTDPTMGNNETRWFKGPEFLMAPFEEWPIKAAVTIKEDENITPQTILMIQTASVTKNPSLISAIEEISPRFKARWTSLIRVIAYQRRYIAKCRNKSCATEAFVTPAEFRTAEDVVFKLIQQSAFPEEFKVLTHDGAPKPVKKSSRLYQLNPFVEDGLIRLMSRAQRANISYNAKNPIVLPNRHDLVDLYIAHIHEKNFHMGEEMTIASARERVWIIDTRSAVQRTRRNCQICKILRASPRMPRMGNLPPARLDFGVKPFTHTGLDAFGPYNVKYGRGTIKRYGLIFTCLSYRAVHLEVLDDLSTDHCLMAIRRFLVRRGGSSHFYSDNGKNFVGARNVLHKELAAQQLQLSELTSRTFQIHWHFQPAYSPWWGGAWERLIQSVKKCIDFVMKNETPQDHVLRNAMTEAEFWMNRRPLTHVPISHEDAEPLSPNLALFGENHDNVAAILSPLDVNEPHSRKASRRAQHLVDKFMSRWVREYLPNIMRRSKWFNETEPVKLDDIVVITDPSQPKTAWRKGKIVKLYPGDDGIVRAADVQLVAQNNTSIIKPNISVGRIAVLDIKSSPSPTRSKTPRGMSSSDGNDDHQDT